MSRRVILSVTNDLSNDQRVHRVAVTLQEMGLEVLLVGRRKRDSKPLDARPYATARMRLWFERGKLFYLAYQWRLFWRLAMCPAHILIANDLDTLLPNYLMARLWGRKLVYDSHEYWTEVPELIDRRLTRWAWLWLERRLFPRVDAAYTVNASIARIYRERYGVDVGVVRNLPLRAQVQPSGTGGRRLIYQGALNVGRGIELMIEAMRHLPGYTLDIAGRGDLDDALRKLVASRPFHPQIRFHGHLQAAELRKLTAGATLGLSLEEDRGLSYHFALPNKLFDYIQAGVPVLVSDLPEMAAVVATHGVGEVLTQTERQPESLANRIRGVCEDVDKRKAFVAACQKAGMELCWENESRQLKSIVQSLG